MINYIDEELDECFDQAAGLILETQKVSASLIQRRLKLGYARAARLLDQLEKAGVVGPADGAKPRKILITKSEYKRPKQVVEEEEMVPKRIWSKLDAKNADKSLKEYLESKEGFDLLLGQDEKEKTVVLDLEKYGSLIVSGSQFTDATKLINQIIASLAAKWSEEELQLILADGMRNDLVFPDRTGYLLTRLITEPDKTISALKWTVSEIERRYKSGEVKPKILAVINGLEVFDWWNHIELVDNIYQVMKFGRKYGVCVVASVDWLDTKRYRDILVNNSARVVFRPTADGMVSRGVDVSTLEKPNQAILWRMFEKNVKFETLGLDVENVYGEIFRVS